MTQPTERRFVMEPRLDAEVETLNLAIDAEETARIAGDALKVAKAGDTMTGALTLNADPTNNLHAATKQYVDNVTINTDNLGDIDYIQFDTTYAGGSTAAGMLAWDQENETLEFMLDDHVTLQIGQEHVMRVKNNSGSVAIPERTVVMFAGAAGDTIKVAPAVSDGSVNVNYLAGITTEEIPADGFGFVTQLGFINQVNTNSWTVGTLLYVDPATPGGLTATEPEAPAWTMPVAAVTKQNISSGRILVRCIPGGSGAGGGASVNISDTAPAGGNAGDMWYDSTDGTLYVYYEDVDGSQWVQVQANSALTAGIESRVGALESQAIALGALSPNYVINGAFDIWQRGTSFSFSGASGAYTTDRWSFYMDGTGAAVTVSQQALPGGAITGAESGRFFVRINRTAAGTGGTYSNFQQPIEDARTLAGKTVTLSFWAKADSTRTVSVFLNQDFGTGGSTSVLSTIESVSLNTSWTRYSKTFTLPSVSGKTISATDSKLWLYIGTPNIVSTIDIWGVQLEAGSTATSFRRNAPSIQAELAACQRYFQTSYQGVAAGTAGAAAPKGSVGLYQHTTTAYLYDNVWLPVIMRTAPTVTVYHPSTGTSGHVNKDNIGVASYDGTAYASVIGVNGFDVLTSPDSNAAARITYHYTATAEL